MIRDIRHPAQTTARVAFLRAINVGGRPVRIERLREVFESLRFEGRHFPG
jgi:uncharacterized protein (DUF1697 family)